MREDVDLERSTLAKWWAYSLLPKIGFELMWVVPPVGGVSE